MNHVKHGPGGVQPVSDPARQEPETGAVELGEDRPKTIEELTEEEDPRSSAEESEEI